MGVDDDRTSADICISGSTVMASLCLPIFQATTRPSPLLLLPRPLLPLCSSGSNNRSVRAWNCQSVHCDDVLHMGGQVGCVVTRGPWHFVGTTDAIRVFNTQTNFDITLSGPVGQVYSLVVSDSGMLFAGTQDPTILAWTFNDNTNCFDPTLPLKGHTLGVVTLVVGANNTRLNSGSIDATIRVWDLDTLQCLEILTQHMSAVMSLLCWDPLVVFLFIGRNNQALGCFTHTQPELGSSIYTHRTAWRASVVWHA